MGRDVRLQGPCDRRAARSQPTWRRWPQPKSDDHLGRLSPVAAPNSAAFIFRVYVKLALISEDLFVFERSHCIRARAGLLLRSHETLPVVDPKHSFEIATRHRNLATQSGRELPKIHGPTSDSHGSLDGRCVAPLGARSSRTKE